MDLKWLCVKTGLASFEPFDAAVMRSRRNTVITSSVDTLDDRFMRFDRIGLPRVAGRLTDGETDLRHSPQRYA